MTHTDRQALQEAIIEVASQSRFDMLAGELKSDHAIKNVELGGGLNLDKSLKMFYARIADQLLPLIDAYTEQRVAEAMSKFGLEKGVKYDVKASDTVIVITPSEAQLRASTRKGEHNE